VSRLRDSVTAREDKTEPVVLKVTFKGFQTDRRVVEDEKALRANRHVAATPDVYGTASRDRREPRAGILGNALLAPGRQCSSKRVLHALLGDVEVVGDSNRRCHHERPLVSVSVRDGSGDGRAMFVVADVQSITRIGRTSTPPKLAGTSWAMARAASRSSASMT